MGVDRRAGAAGRVLLALLTVDVASSAVLVLAATRGRGARVRLGSVAAVAALGVGTAAPLLARASSASATGRTRAAAAAMVCGGLVWNTVGSMVVARAAERERGRSPFAAHALLVLGDLVSAGYLVQLVRLRSR